MRHPGKPFRWNTANPKLIQRLGQGEIQTLPDYQIDRLIRCAATTLRAGDFDFVFVGRSLESVFDLLSGALARTTWYDRIQQLQISAQGNQSILDLRDEYLAFYREFLWAPRSLEPFGSKLDAFHSYLEYLQLTPEKLMSRTRSIAFVDVVWKGTTFGAIWDLLQVFAKASDISTAELAARIHWVAVIPTLPDDDPDTPWEASRSDWTQAFQTSVHCVNLDSELWFQLANSQFKTTPSHHVSQWDQNSKPPETGEHYYDAARGAREFYRRGERSRKRLAALLDESPEPQECTKRLAREMRREAKQY